MEELQLPDFDDLISLANQIGTLKTELLIAKGRLAVLRAEITEKVTSDDAYLINGKRPSMKFIEGNYHNLGINEGTRIELATLRLSIAEKEGALKRTELLFDVYRAMIDVWRTESANKRGAYFEG